MVGRYKTGYIRGTAHCAIVRVVRVGLPSDFPNSFPNDVSNSPGDYRVQLGIDTIRHV